MPSRHERACLRAPSGRCYQTLVALNCGDLMLLPEAAALVNVPVESLRYWVKQGRLRRFKPGKRVLVLRSDVVALVMRSASGGIEPDPGVGTDDGTPRPAGVNVAQQSADTLGRPGERWRGKRGAT